MPWDMPYPLDPKMMQLMLQAQAVRNKPRGATGSWGPPQASSANNTLDGATAAEQAPSPAQASAPARAPAPAQAPVSGTSGPYDQSGQDPELLRQVAAGSIGLSGAEEEQAALQQQMATADELRNTALPEGRGYGGVYTAANPLETAGSLLKQYKGWKERGSENADVTKRTGILGKMQTGRENTKSARDRIIAAILKSSGGSVASGGPGGFRGF